MGAISKVITLLPSSWLCRTCLSNIETLDSERLSAEQVEDLSNIPDLEMQMAKAGLRWPCILKPLLACGPAWAHELAITASPQALADAQVHGFCQETVARCALQRQHQV